MTATSPHDVLPIWAWAVILVLAALLIATIGDVAARLLFARRSSPLGPAPYDWEHDDGLLDVWARDGEGEVLTVIPASWRYR